MVFWNEEIGKENEINNINIDSEEKIRLLDLIRQNDETHLEYPDVPMLFSNCTNWRGRPFMKVSEFMARTHDLPDVKGLALDMAKESL